MLDSNTVTLIDSLVGPILDVESRELNRKLTRAAEQTAQAGLAGSGLAQTRQIIVHYDHHKELAAAVWSAMLRVLQVTQLAPFPGLPADLKRRFDAYMAVPANRTGSSMVAFDHMSRTKSREAFDGVYTEVRTKYHTEINLYCSGVAAEQRRLDEARTAMDTQQQRVPEFSDLPMNLRLHVDEIDSFQKVRDVDPGTVADLLEGAYFDRSEDSIQIAFEEILAVPMHKKDWGGETNDLYTANVVAKGRRIETAFLLKGNGLKRRKLEIRDCGVNGDQLLRLVNSPARLFVVQFVGNVSESVISDLDGKVGGLQAQGKEAWYCIIDGQDTARLLRAYGKA